jgi:hypothetical protein
VLGFLASNRGKNPAAPPLAAAEVTAARGRHPDRSAQATRVLRPALPAP